MQRHVRAADAGSLDLAKQCISEVEPGCGCRDSTRHTGEDGLVALDVVLVGLSSDIWRQRDTAVSGKCL